MSVPLTADFVPIPLPDFVEHSPDDMQRRAEAFYEGLRRRHTRVEGSRRASWSTRSERREVVRRGESGGCP